jgi:hypothetical protein
MIAEIVRPRPLRLRDWSPAQVREDLELVRQGKLYRLDFLKARQYHDNPVKVEVHDRRGLLKAVRYTHNLRTNDGINWQARQMGGGPSSATLAAAGFQQTNTSNIAITAPSGSTVGLITDTNTNVTAATALLNQFIGCSLVMANKVAHLVGNKAAGSNTVAWYFDNWFSASDFSATVAAPSAGAYSILAGGNPAFYVGLSTNSGAQGATDHTIGNVTSGASAEIGSGFASAPSANGLGRAFAAAATNWSHTAGAASYVLKNVFTASGTFTAVQQCGMFTGFNCPGDTESGDLTNAGQGGGVMVFENSFSSVNMISGDQLTITWTVSY